MRSIMNGRSALGVFYEVPSPASLVVYLVHASCGCFRGRQGFCYYQALERKATQDVESDPHGPDPARECRTGLRALAFPDGQRWIEAARRRGVAKRARTCADDGDVGASGEEW